MFICAIILFLLATAASLLRFLDCSSPSAEVDAEDEDAVVDEVAAIEEEDDDEEVPDV